MNKYLRKGLYVGLSALMVAGLSASMNNAHASINPDSYGIDVFPSKKTHNKFAYQLRRRGHNSRVYYSSKNSKLGRAIFDHGNPNIDYANYMDRYHHGWYNFITKKLEGHVLRRAKVQKKDRKTTNKRVQKRTRKAIPKRRRVTKRGKNNKHTKLVKHYNRKARVIRKRNKRPSKLDVKVLKSRFKRSNNKRLLKRSGYRDAKMDPKQLSGADFIINKYSPNDNRAVVPKNFKGTNWLQESNFGQKNPKYYQYQSKAHGWKLF